MAGFAHTYKNVYVYVCYVHTHTYIRETCIKMCGEEFVGKEICKHV